MLSAVCKEVKLCQPSCLPYNIAVEGILEAVLSLLALNFNMSLHFCWRHCWHPGGELLARWAFRACLLLVRGS